MDEFEIMLSDLTPEAQARFLEFIGSDGEDNYDVFPIATVVKDED